MLAVPVPHEEYCGLDFCVKFGEELKKRIYPVDELSEGRFKTEKEVRMDDWLHV